jgi:transposase
MAHGPRITIPLDIPDVRVLRTEQTKAGEYIVTIESTITTTPCRRCGRMLTDMHGFDDARQLRHLAIFGCPVYLQIRPKRFRCWHCDGHPTTTQQLEWYDPHALHTKAYERHLIVQLINSTFTDVEAKEDVTTDALIGILDRWIATTVAWERLDPFHVLGIDEIALTKGHRNFVAVITARTDDGCVYVLAVLPDRLKTTVATWLRMMPALRRDQITTVCTDMWEGYVTAVQEELPQRRIVIDRFHVARHYRDAVDDLRKQEIRRLQQELPEHQRVELKRTMWLVRKELTDLTDDEQTRLARLFTYSPALQQAHTLRTELTTIFDTARSKADGLRRIQFWRQRVERSGLTCFDSFLKLLDTWRDSIANYFIDHHTSSFVEGLNNKLKVLKRRCYGIRNIERLFQRLTLDLSGYRWFSPWRTAHH